MTALRKIAVLTVMIFLLFCGQPFIGFEIANLTRGATPHPVFVSHGGETDPENPSIVSRKQITLRWRTGNVNDPTEKYALQISILSDFRNPLVDVALEEEYYNFTHFQNNVTYYWRVKELTGTGWSEFSDTFSFTPRFSPVLSWTGEKGFIGDGVHPNRGLRGDVFNFRILYKDEYGERPPDSVNLHLLSPDETLSRYELTALGNDSSYSRGVIYTKSLQLDLSGNYEYYFDAVFDGGLGEVRMPTSEDDLMSSPEVNTPPELSGGISSTYGVESSVFRYNVVFTDRNNDPPDPKHSFVYIDGDAYPMIEENVYDTDTANGKDFYYEIEGLSKGVHDFYFEFKDSFGTKVDTNITFHPIIYDGWPDLKISSSDIVFEREPGSGNLVIEATVHNNGKGAATDIPVVFWLGDPDEYDKDLYPIPNVTESYHYLIPYLARAQQYTVRWVTKIRYNVTQSERIFVTVDLDYDVYSDPYHAVAFAKKSGEDIREVIEYSDTNTNNKAYNVFSYGPDIEIRDIDVSPRSVLYRSRVFFLAKVRNVGSVEVPAGREIVVRFILTLPNRRSEVTVGTYTIKGGMIPHSAWEARSSYEFVGDKEAMLGKWELMVSAQVSGTFYELDAENNAVEVPVQVVEIEGEALTPSFAPSVWLLLLVTLILTLLTKRTEEPYDPGSQGRI